MGSIIKIGEDYYIEFFARGLRYRRNGGKREEDARKLLDDIESKIKQGEMTIVTPEITVEQFCADFLQNIQETDSVPTYARYKSVVHHFKKYCQDVLKPQAQLSKVTPSLIEEYRVSLVKKHIRPNIINFTILLLRNMLDHAINCGYLNDNPTLHTQCVPVKGKPAVRILSVENWEQVLSSASDSLNYFLMALRRTGMRVHEAIGLKWSKVDFKTNCLKIGRNIPIDGELLATLRILEKNKKSGQELIFMDNRGCPWTKEALIKELNPIAGTLSLSAETFLSVLRNTFVQDVLDKGVSLFDLKKLLGLNDVARVMRYAGFVNKE